VLSLDGGLSLLGNFDFKLDADNEDASITIILIGLLFVDGRPCCDDVEVELGEDDEALTRGTRTWGKLSISDNNSQKQLILSVKSRSARSSFSKCYLYILYNLFVKI
jgi:hypothetical protein